MINYPYIRGTLPPYLAYGILDESSITYLDGVLQANYVFEFDGSVVHKIAWGEEFCDLHTYLHGKKYRTTRYPDLQKALLYDCAGWRLGENDCFYFLAKKISRMGRIFVQHPSAGANFESVCYFPAGKLYAFSLPLLERTSAYFAFLDVIKNQEHVRFHGERKCTLLLETHNSEVLSKEIIIADFIVPLAYLVSAAEVFISAGILAKEKYLRLMVHEAHCALGVGLQIYKGDHEFLKFGLCFPDVDEARHKALLNAFRETMLKLPL